METQSRSNLPLINGVAPADSALSRAAVGIHGAVDKLARVADDAASNVKPGIDHAASLAHDAVNRVADVARPTAEWMREHGDSMTATRLRMTAEAGKYVTANPFKSIGIALLVGLLMSRLIH